MSCCVGWNTSPRSMSNTSGVHQAHLGWAVTVTGPDLVRIQLHTEEGPSGEVE